MEEIEEIKIQEDDRIYYSGSISLGGGAVTEGGDMVEGDRITLQQLEKGQLQIKYVPQAEAARSAGGPEEMDRRLEVLRAAIDHDKNFGFKEKSALAILVASVRDELQRTPPDLEQVRDRMKSLKSAIGEEHPPIASAADDVWSYVINR